VLFVDDVDRRGSGVLSSPATDEVVGRPTSATVELLLDRERHLAASLTDDRGSPERRQSVAGADLNDRPAACCC